MADPVIFATPEFMQAIKEKLNKDEKYAQIAQNWEGDVRLVIEPDSTFPESRWLYFDLWHGKCRDAYIEDHASPKTPAFILTAPYANYMKLLSGEWSPMQALMTRRLGVHGSLAYMMRNVPTVLDFVRCCQEVSQNWQ